MIDILLTLINYNEEETEVGIKNTLIGLSVVCMMVPSFATSAEAKGSADQKVNDSIVADWKFSKGVCEKWVAPKWEYGH